VRDGGGDGNITLRYRLRGGKGKAKGYYRTGYEGPEGGRHMVLLFL
jgi:hypothetical protein